MRAYSAHTVLDSSPSPLGGLAKRHRTGTFPSRTGDSSGLSPRETPLRSGTFPSSPSRPRPSLARNLPRRRDPIWDENAPHSDEVVSGPRPTRDSPQPGKSTSSDYNFRLGGARSRVERARSRALRPCTALHSSRQEGIPSISPSPRPRPARDLAPKGSSKRILGRGDSGVLGSGTRKIP